MRKKTFILLGSVVIMFVISFILIICILQYPKKTFPQKTKILYENLGIEYTSNENGTFSCNGKTYLYRLVLQGRERAAVCDTEYIILTNNKNLTFNDVANIYIYSTPNGKRVFLDSIIVGIRTLNSD